MKLLFYLVILAVWIISNLKKQGHWEEKIPEFPEDSGQAPKPQEEQPEEEGYFPEAMRKKSPQPESELPVPTYEEKLALRQKQLHRLKTHAKEPAAVVTVPPGKQPQTIKTATTAILSEKGKEPLALQSNIKEGIIWSIILGPPRSKLRFDGKTPPLQR